MNSIVEKLAAIEKEIAAIQPKMEPITERIAALDQKIVGFAHQLTSLTEESAAVKQDIELTRASLTRIQALIGESKVESEQFVAGQEENQQRCETMTAVFGAAFQAVSQFFETAQRMGLADQAKTVFLSPSSMPATFTLPHVPAPPPAPAPPSGFTPVVPPVSESLESKHPEQKQPPPSEEPPVYKPDPPAPEPAAKVMPAEPPAEESVIEEPIIKKPVIEEPVVKKPVVEEPVIKKSAVAEPVVKEPAVEEPVIKEPAVEEPVIKKPVIAESVVKEPAVEEPVIKKLVIKEPVVAEQIVAEPPVANAVETTEISNTKESESTEPPIEKLFPGPPAELPTMTELPAMELPAAKSPAAESILSESDFDAAISDFGEKEQESWKAPGLPDVAVPPVMEAAPLDSDSELAPPAVPPLADAALADSDPSSEMASHLDVSPLNLSVPDLPGHDESATMDEKDEEEIEAMLATMMTPVTT